MLELKFTGLGLTTTLYTASLSPRGLITAWKGQHERWKHGFVVRAFWLGFVVRWGRIPYSSTPRAKFWQIVEQANDGDYPRSYL